MTEGAKGSSAYDGQNFYHADVFLCPNPIHIGAGDAFDAGLLYAFMEGKSLAEALVYGNAIAALKLTIAGDIALVTREEVETFLQNQTSSVIR